MSFFGGLDFFVYLFLLMIPAIILGIKGKKIKYYSCFVTLFFIFNIFKNDVKQFMYLALYCFFEFYLIRIFLFLNKKFNRNRELYIHTIIFSILPLVIYKLTNIVDFNIFGFLGISYLTFKVIQIIIEIYDGLIDKINVFDFFNFLLFFPTLTSGPIDRSRRFKEDFNKKYTKDEYLDLLGNGISKITLGVFYKFVLSTILYGVMLSIAERYKPLYIVAYSFLYGLYMFFDFAGYSLMAIGTSYVFGIKTPDNFDKPFISVDIKDFWNRWHITLSHWFRDFIFTRFMMDSLKKKRFKSRLSTAFIAFMVNMTIMGVWHGLSWYYVLYGIYHGLLLGLTEIYQKKCKFYKNNKNKIWYKILSWFVTMNAVAFGFLIFSGRLGDIVKVYIDVLVK